MIRREPPQIRELSTREMSAVLHRNHVGRIAYHDRGEISIQPIHYVFTAGWIYCRTAEGSKLAALQHNPRVSFEVDEVEGTFSWRSVLVHGDLQVLERDGDDATRARWDWAVELLRRFLPETLAPGDPVPFRRVVFRIAVRKASGREARRSERPKGRRRAAAAEVVPQFAG